MKTKLFYSLVVLASACGGGGGGVDTSTILNPRFNDGVDDCLIITNEIHLSSGEHCDLTSAQASAHNLSAGELRCNNGILTFSNSEFNAEEGVRMNDLTFYCELRGN